MRFLSKCLLASLLSVVVISAALQHERKGEPAFVPTKVRSEYLRMPVSELAPMLDWLENAELSALAKQSATDPASTVRVSYYLLHSKLLRGQDTQVLSLIHAARSAEDKPIQQDMQFMLEELLAEARVNNWDEARFTAAATQRVAALPLPAARSRLKELLEALDARPVEESPESLAALDVAFARPPLNAPLEFAGDILERRFSNEILGPHASVLHAIVMDRLDREPEDAAFWQKRAYPQLPRHGERVRIAIWEPDGIDIALFRHPDRGCLILGAGTDCLVDPRIDGMDRLHVWNFVKGYHDTLARKPTPQAKAWQHWQDQYAGEIGSLPGGSQRAQQLAQKLGTMNGEVQTADARQHGTHVAGIAVDGNPFAELIAIRDNMLLAKGDDGFRRIGNHLSANHVRIVNMSWGFDAARKQPAEVTAFEKDMLRLFSAFPDILFVAAAGNENNAIDRRNFLPGSLSAPNLLTVGAVDQDGQVTSFTNVGANVALYANGYNVRSVGPTGYPLEMSGTSMAAPQVCNVAAKLLSQHPGLSVTQLKQLLLEGADELPAGRQLSLPVRVLNPARTAGLAASNRSRSGVSPGL